MTAAKNAVRAALTTRAPADIRIDHVGDMTEQAMRDHWAARSNVPYGSLMQTADQFRTRLDMQFSVQQVRNLLNNNNAVNQRQVWSELIDTSLHERYVAARMYMGYDVPEGGDDEDEERQPQGGEDEEDENRHRTTPPVSFTRLVRNELDGNLIFSKVKEAAQRATLAVSNTSAIVKATMCRMATMNTEVNGQVCTLEEEVAGFNMATVLPEMFELRDESMLDRRGHLNVAIPNHGLKEALQATYPVRTTAKDLKDMYSFSHISFIHSSHLGQRERTQDTSHALWSALVFQDAELPHTHTGMSTTVSQALWSYATNLARAHNIRQGTRVRGANLAANPSGTSTGRAKVPRGARSL